VAAPSTVEVATDAISIEVAKAAAAQPAKRETDVFMGFARVFSGVLRPGQEVYVLLPRYNPADPTQHFHKVTIDKIYLMMGRDLEELDEVPPGNLVSIEGLAETVLKSATISSTLSCPPFGKVHGAVWPHIHALMYNSLQQFIASSHCPRRPRAYQSTYISTLSFLSPLP